MFCSTYIMKKVSGNISLLQLQIQYSFKEFNPFKLQTANDYSTKVGFIFFTVPSIFLFSFEGPSSINDIYLYVQLHPKNPLLPKN